MSQGKSLSKKRKEKVLRKGKFSQLSVSDRLHIQVGLDNGESFTSIAKHLDRSPSTISREVSRNSKERLSHKTNDCQL